MTRKVALEKDVGQIPVTISTFTNERKLYLSPGVNMRTAAEHPEELTDPVLPYPRKTKLEFKPGKWRGKFLLSHFLKNATSMCEAGVYGLTTQ